MKYMMLKLFEAGLGSSVLAIIFSGVAVVRFLRVCYCVLVCVKKERHGKHMLSTPTVLMRIRVNGLLCACQWTPPSRKKKHGLGH